MFLATKKWLGWLGFSEQLAGFAAPFPGNGPTCLKDGEKNQASSPTATLAQRNRGWGSSAQTRDVKTMPTPRSLKRPPQGICCSNSEKDEKEIQIAENPGTAVIH